jgi:hypothetical protein
MDVLQLAGRFGESALDVFVERLNTSSITIDDAWLRPDDNPFADRLPVKPAFIKLLRAQGGMMITAQTVSPAALLEEPADNSLWSRGMRAFHKKPSQAKPVLPKCWLGVNFTVPGGAHYTACYLLPEELVTFPPPMKNVRNMTPIDRQIVRCAIKAVPKDPPAELEDDDEDKAEPNTLLDFTDSVRAMAGPDGDFFGRAVVDLRLPLAEATESCRNPRQLLQKFVEHVSSKNETHVQISVADGSELQVQTALFSWPK